MKQNANVYVVKTQKDGKTYYNLYNEITLDNGEVVIIQVKHAFYNKKLAYKLRVNLPTKEGK